jgi:hypothetical protein
MLLGCFLAGSTARPLSVGSRRRHSLRVYLSEYTCGQYSVLSERRRLENLIRSEQKGALNLRPRHSSGDTTIIPLSGLVNRWRTGSGSAPAGVAQSEGKIGKIFLFREKIKRGWDFLMRILLAFLACRCVGRGVR